MEIHKIAEDVKGFALANNELYWSSANELIKLENGITKSILKSKEKLQEVKFETPYIFVPDIYGNSYIVQIDPKYHQNIFIKKVIDKDKVIVSHDRKTKLYNPIDRSIKDLLNHRIFHFFQEENWLFAEYEKNIVAYSIETGELIWTQSIEKLLGFYSDIRGSKKDYKVTRFIGIQDNKIVIQLTNVTLVALNFETGESSNILNLNEKVSLTSNSFYDDFCHPHITNDKIIWLNNQRLMNIDTSSFAVKIIKDYFNEPKGEQFRFMKNTMYKGKILFTADKGSEYITPSRIGLMDSKDGKILWEHQLIKTGGIPESPTVCDNKMYIKTANKTLYSVNIDKYINQNARL